MRAKRGKPKGATEQSFTAGALVEREIAPLAMTENVRRYLQRWVWYYNAGFRLSMSLLQQRQPRLAFSTVADFPFVARRARARNVRGKWRFTHTTAFP